MLTVCCPLAATLRAVDRPEMHEVFDIRPIREMNALGDYVDTGMYVQK